MSTHTRAIATQTKTQANTASMASNSGAPTGNARIARQAKELPSIIVSGGKLGSQLELAPEDLCRAAGAEYAQITQDDTES